MAKFIKHWDETGLVPTLFPLIVIDIFEHLHEKDKEYFRKTREALLDQPLELAGGDRRERIHFKLLVQRHH
ncbi:MAG: hypothetical protein ACFE0I_03320 [Elainellaceae cyanobacterium]